MWVSRCLVFLLIAVGTAMSSCVKKNLCSFGNDYIEENVDDLALVTSFTPDYGSDVDNNQGDCTWNRNSENKCKEANAFGFTGSRVWVAEGCQARFTLCTQARAPTNWKVTTTTCEGEVDGTNAKVWIKLIGTKESDFIRVDDKGGENVDSFEPGQVDTFSFSTPYLGDVTILWIRREKGHSRDSPNLKLCGEVVLENTATGEIFNSDVFEGGETIRIKPRSTTFNLSPQHPQPQTHWTFTTTTCGEDEDGTNANVWIRLIGTETSSFKKLEVYNKDGFRANSFEPDQVDTFSFSTLNIGDVTRVQIDRVRDYSNSLPSPNLKLCDELVLKNEATGDIFNIKLNEGGQWIRHTPLSNTFNL